MTLENLRNYLETAEEKYPISTSQKWHFLEAYTGLLLADPSNNITQSTDARIIYKSRIVSIVFRKIRT